MRLLDAAVALAAARDGPVFIGLAGAQGSGKSTMARAYAMHHPEVALLSLDDFYLGRAERARLAAAVHPLLATRGVPGTHDLALLAAVPDALETGDPVRAPLFDKLADDVAPREAWREVRGRPRVILVEGWCLGATAQGEAALAEPVNALEREQDPDGRWRRFVNDQLAGPYAALFARFDAIAYLRAPSFERVLDWRCEQQEGLLGRPLSEAERGEIAGFVAHFERITRHMMGGGVRADLTVQLDRDRKPLPPAR